MKILDIGCGTKRAEPGAIGIDVSARSGAEIVWDLDNFPWPVESGQFDRIYMSHIIEHVRDVHKTMAEVHRIARPDAEVIVVTPHYSSHNSFTDPTHVRHLAGRSFQYFTGDDFATFTGSPVRFRIEELRLTFGRNFLLDSIGRCLAGRNLEWYECHAAWIFPARDIYCRLRAAKP